MSPQRETPNKPALTIEEQIELLRNRGMVLDNKDRVRHALEHLNYYRLRGYWMSFEEPGGHGDHRFRPCTTFESVIELYEFDRRLRLTIIDAIEPFEISLRTHWAYVLGTRYGPIAHRNSALFNTCHQKLLSGIEALYNNRKEIFLKHYLEHDKEPPIWVLCEVLSLGNLSKWLRSLKHQHDRQAIADAYKLREKPFCSFVERIAYIRNVCAHHGRLWNRPLPVASFALPKKPHELAEQLQRDPAHAKRLYNTLTMLVWLMRIVSPGSPWEGRMRRLIASREDLCEAMGFPQEWKHFKLWGEDSP